MQTLTLPLAWSRSVLASGFVAHALPFVASFAAGVPQWVPMVVALGVLASSGLCFLRARAFAATSILLRDNGEAELLSNGISTHVDMQDSCADLGFLVVLRWRTVDALRTESAVLTRDGLTEGQWRALRTWVRWRLNRSSA